MDPSLEPLLRRLDQLPEQFRDIREGVRQAAVVADLDPEMALTRARKVLELMVRALYERRANEPAGTRPLENLLDRLVKDGHMPRRPAAFANAVRILGNVGTHTFGERFSPADVQQSLAQLLPVVEWYVEAERPAAAPPPADEPAEAPAPGQPAHAPAVVPKGLRSFDAADARFFLDLLLGPRDERGLPESLRFWKQRIEPTGELTFTVGVLYGPSGSGKSSLVKAGLLPRLAGHVLAVYVEAGADDTEARLLRGLRRCCPQLPHDAGLVDSLLGLRTGQALPPGRKVLIVLDQFEQWLHARRGEEDTELVRALRQLVLGKWVDALRPVGAVLLPALAGFLEDDKRSAEQRRTIAGVYGTYAADSPDAFAQLEKRLAEESEANASDEAKLDLARRQANLGVALVLMGRGESVWPLLKHSPDPTRRSYLLDRLGPGGVAARVLGDRLDGQTEVSVRRALLLALGEFDRERLTPAEREGLDSRLAALYRDDPDPGVHGAAGWLLRRWGQQATVEAIDQASRGRQPPEGSRGWYVNGQGQTLVIVPPGEFDMGDEPERKRVRIDRSFALAARDVTVAEFRRFRKQHDYAKDYAQTEDCPVNNVSWYDAAAYCNWLSKEEGIVEDQWCYLPNEKGEYVEGMKVAAGWRGRSGYRLPTEVEWEVACRAGSVTPWSMGAAEDLLPKYAWFYASSFTHSHPAGSLRPNDLGLFDMHGNIWQWCQDRWVDDDKEREEAPGDMDGLEDKVDNKSIRMLRGGAFNAYAADVRSGARYQDAPASHSFYMGFRPARTFR